jgi:deoxyribodipyrimidine photolyase-related protein
MKLKKQYKTLRLILGDQLNAQHSWYKEKDSSILYVIAELKQETTYVKHHIQKVCAFFSSMQQFSSALMKAGHHVLHLTLDETVKHKDLCHLIQHLTKHYQVNNFHYQRPDEYRLCQQLQTIKLKQAITINEVDTEHFLLPFDEIEDYFSPTKHQKMEFFYRKMRKRFTILIQGDNPEGGKWNFDADNRNKLKATDIDCIPAPLVFTNDVSDILDRLKRHKINTFGKTETSLLWPTSRRQALQLLRHFCEYCLPNFGKFQDAMTCNSQHQWSLYHSRLSFSLNCKMLHPLQVLQSAIDAYQKKDSNITLPQIEGFIRQILGWREYIRGVYWVNMPSYETLNHYNASNKLPDYFWTGNTRMNCMKNAIGQSLDYAYAHHIQRLMVTGNFCLLAGIDPKQVDEWYLGVYIDAIEWVEMPNTRGMSQFADGGIVATKPYSASGNYTNKMSDYCKTCHYKVKDKVGDQACPFNSLYWYFMQKNRATLEKNPRIGMVYKNWDKQDSKIQTATLERARWCIDNLEEL